MFALPQFIPTKQYFHHDHYRFTLLQQPAFDFLMIDIGIDDSPLHSMQWLHYIKKIPLRRRTRLLLIDDSLWHDSVLLSLDPRIDRKHVYRPDNRPSIFTHACEKAGSTALWRRCTTLHRQCLCL